MLATVRSNVQRSCLRRATFGRLSLSPTAYAKRTLSVSHLDPSVQSFASALAEKQPYFSMSSRDVHILSEPEQFYVALLDIIQRARRRIFISSLYIGSEEQELIDSLHASLRNHPSLNVYLTLDLNRSTRPGPSSTIDAILPLLREFPEHVHVFLFRSPKLRGLLAKLVPPRFNEGWGTWHAKIYGADDEVMISGANLNKSYFTDRQDRYLRFKNQPGLAQYCFSFLETVGSFSHRVLLPSAPLSSKQYDICWPHSHTDPSHIQSKADALSSFQSTCLAQQRTLTSKNGDDVLVFPIIQAGQFGIREEERFMSLLFRHLASQTPSSTFKPLLDLTSGYFGLYNPYQNLILNSSVDCRIIAASPKANGFFGSSGISGRIPEGYTLLEQRFMRAVKASGRIWLSGTGVQLTEWQRLGWTYHAKGIWLSPTPRSHPVLTLFGSTNLNSRSAHLDTELSFVLMTSSTAVRKRLQEEVEELRKFAIPWRGDKRKVRWGTKAIVGVVGGML